MTIPLASAVSSTFYKWKLSHVPAAPLTTTVLVVSAVALMPLEAAPGLMTSLRIGSPTGTSISAEVVIYLLLLGVIGSGVSTVAYFWLVLKRGALFAGMTTYVVPVIALLWGTLDHEVISGQQAMAIAGVLGMVALVQSGAKTGDEVLEPAAAGDFVTSLPLSAEASELVTLPMREMPLTDRRAVSSQSQVA